MKWISALIVLSAMTLVSRPGRAVVDMKNASFVDVWTDLIVPGTGYDLKVRRGYKSRSLFAGMFGFGWCSDFETSLDITPEGNLKLTECGAGLEIVYTPRNFSPAEVDKTVAQIVVSHKKEHPKLDKAFYQDFEKKLKANTALRSHYASLYKIKIPVKPGTVFYANGREVDRITYSNDGYTRYLSDGTMNKFDTDGKVVFMSDKNGNHLKFSYDKEDYLRQIVDNSGRSLSFKYDPSTRRVKQITGPHNLSVTYTFAGQDLVQVKNAWNHIYNYKYDDLHNLVRISFPDGTFKQLTYDQDKDWVTSFQARNGCIEKYNYEPQEDDPKNHYISTVVKSCKGKVITQASYEFWHKKNEDGQSYLARVRSSQGSDTSDVVYHPIFGRPLSVGQNGRYTHYTYFDNGLVKTKEIDKVKSHYEYNNKFNKVSRVTTVHVDAKGKPVKKHETDFFYDNRANLYSAKNSEGQHVQLKYDKFGRIAVIEDQAKRVVKIKYDPKLGKPVYVDRPGVGAITVSYKPNGEILQVKSKEGPTVANQVTSTFNNLLELIGPATEELSF